MWLEEKQKPPDRGRARASSSEAVGERGDREQDQRSELRVADGAERRLRPEQQHEQWARASDHRPRAREQRDGAQGAQEEQDLPHGERGALVERAQRGHCGRGPERVDEGQRTVRHALGIGVDGVRPRGPVVGIATRRDEPARLPEAAEVHDVRVTDRDGGAAAEQEDRERDEDREQHARRPWARHAL